MIQQLVLSTHKKLKKGKQDQGLNAQTFQRINAPPNLGLDLSSLANRKKCALYRFENRRRSVLFF